MSTTSMSGIGWPRNDGSGAAIAILNLAANVMAGDIGFGQAWETLLIILAGGYGRSRVSPVK